MTRAAPNPSASIATQQALRRRAPFFISAQRGGVWFPASAGYVARPTSAKLGIARFFRQDSDPKEKGSYSNIQLEDVGITQIEVAKALNRYLMEAKRLIT